MSQSENNEGWEVCPKGAIANLVKSKKLEQRRQFLQRSFVAGGSVAVASIGLAVLASQKQWFREQPPLALSCLEVVNYLPAYLDGELDAETRRAIDHHLDDCPHCAEKKKQMESNS